MRYKNLTTGIIIDIDSELSGGDWIEIPEPEEISESEDVTESEVDSKIEKNSKTSKK